MAEQPDGRGHQGEGKGEGGVVGDGEGEPGRARLSAIWASLRQDASLKGQDWSRAATEVTDAWLRDVFDQAVAAAGAAKPAGQPKGPLGGLFSKKGQPPEAASGPAAAGAALVAVGSLGRADLAPGSDLDLVIVHAGRPDIAEVADRIWYPIWDDPMPLDHSVRTLAQVGQAAEADLRVALGLLDARFVAGDASLAEGMVALGPRLWSKRVGRWLPEVLAARAGTELALGEVAFLLEPELQEGRGGLRDVQLLSLMASVTPVAPGLLANPAFGAAADFLHAVRVELQRESGRRTERLALEDQDRVAAALGIDSREALAHKVAAAGRTISWLVEDVSRRARSWLAGPRGRAGSADRVIGPGLVVRDNEVAVPLAAPVAADPTLALRAATASAELGLPLARTTMERLEAEARAPEGPWEEEPRRAFLRLLSAGPGSVHAVETLDHLGVWERYVPEWVLVRNRPQFNPYHRWTVDRHLLETAANAAGEMFDVHRPDMLVTAALMHDIGKGTGEDHSESGAVIARGFAERLGFAGDDARLLETLVRYHLLLPDTATRRDLEDPRTISYVAELVGDRTTLELLAALAPADGLATGAAAWSEWKAFLVGDLAQRVGALLEGKPVPLGAPFPSEEHRRLLSAGAFQVVPDEKELTVVAHDRPGLLSDVSGALALHKIGVLEARAHSEGGMALEVLMLDLPPLADPRWERVVADIGAAVEKRLNIEEALARHRPPAGARKLAGLAAAGVKVIVDNEAATNATVVEVRAPDSPGFLHRATAAIAALGLDITSARVATLGTVVVDTFYVQADGAKLAGEDEAGRLGEALRSALA
ncbi:MAG TPA: [protein-PII] uridylyltransferase [Acidimicrobiales bacterium]|nr:[protein-PII] uridylyltransferase [Acidimicrobiales bacterium]